MELADWLTVFVFHEGSDARVNYLYHFKSVTLKLTYRSKTTSWMKSAITIKWWLISHHVSFSPGHFDYIILAFFLSICAYA